VALDEAVADAAMVKAITTVDAEEDEPTLWQAWPRCAVLPEAL
jgi:hypothetical protein